jgi:acylphosphatase
MEDKMADKALHAIIEGRVQGVYFRDYTWQQAERLGLKGWVRNLPNGTVEALIAGKIDKVDEMVAWFHRGSPLSSVKKVTITQYTGNEQLSGFEILY